MVNNQGHWEILIADKLVGNLNTKRYPIRMAKCEANRGRGGGGSGGVSLDKEGVLRFPSLYGSYSYYYMLMLQSSVFVFFFLFASGVVDSKEMVKHRVSFLWKW